ncbi:adenylyl-sulfate kinase [Paenibacillus sp. y28]|uniref:adenylyl-sulfate kinase n=1 Tax=Paenibacillus sp. y28 TaxID=3129110 RepID=UPI00301A3B3C
MKPGNIKWQTNTITKTDRQLLNGHKSCVLWFTGLSGSGKSTLANEVEKQLYAANIRTYILDGDNVRHGLNNNLGFSPEDRKENVRRISEVCKLFVDAGLFVLSAFISPYKEDRDSARHLFNESEFIEVFVKCDLDICEARDVKGMYKKARAGEIKEFTGISAPYEAPVKPELVIETDKQTIEDSVQQIISYLKQNHYIA